MSFPYGAHETKIYYVQETSYGEPPANPSMIGVKAENIEPGLDPGLIRLRGLGSRDLQTIKAGLKDLRCKVDYPLPSDNPIDFLQYITALNSLSLELFWEKTGAIIDLLYKGCRFDKATVECSVEDVVKASIEIMAQAAIVRTAKVTGATYTDYSGAVPFYESQVDKGAGDGSNPVNLQRVSAWKFNIENNLKAVPVIKLGDYTCTLYADAAAGQKNVQISFMFGPWFLVGDVVKIYDDNASEWNIVKANDGGTPTTLTMLNNLQNTYVKNNNGKISKRMSGILKYLPARHRTLSGEVTFEFESKEEFEDLINDNEFSLRFGLGGTKSALFKYCKWEKVATPTRIEDLVSLKASFVARDVVIS